MLAVLVSWLLVGALIVAVELAAHGDELLDYLRAECALDPHTAFGWCAVLGAVLWPLIALSWLRRWL